METIGLPYIPSNQHTTTFIYDDKGLRIAQLEQEVHLLKQRVTLLEGRKNESRRKKSRLDEASAER